MTLTIHPSQAYALLAGLFVGKFTNIFSDVVITGLVLYIVTPEIFTENRLDRAKNYFYSWFKTQPQMVKFDISNLPNLSTEQQKQLMIEQQKLNLHMFDLSKLPKIEIIPSPKIQTQTYYPPQVY
jgi:hypothetical protein